MLICSNISFQESMFLTFTTLCQLIKKFTMLILRKLEITIDFNGKFGHLWGVITH